MATIEERKQQLENKLKKMAEDNVVVKPVTIPNSFDPSEDTESSPATSGEEDNNLEGTTETKTAKEKPIDEIEREETGKETENGKARRVLPFHRGLPFPVLSSHPLPNADNLLH